MMYLATSSVADTSACPDPDRLERQLEVARPVPVAQELARRRSGHGRRSEQRAVETRHGDEDSFLGAPGRREQETWLITRHIDHQSPVGRPSDGLTVQAGHDALAQNPGALDAAQPLGEGRPRIAPAGPIGRPRCHGITLFGHDVDLTAALRLEEGAEHLRAKTRESLELYTAELGAEGRHDRGGGTDGGAVGGNHHEGTPEERGLQRRDEVGTGNIKEIAPRRRQRGDERALGWWKGQLYRVRRHPEPAFAPRGRGGKLAAAPPPR